LIKSQGLIISKGEKFRKFPDWKSPKILEVEKWIKKVKKRVENGLNVASDDARPRPLTPTIWTKTKGEQTGTYGTQRRGNQ